MSCEWGGRVSSGVNFNHCHAPPLAWSVNEEFHSDGHVDSPTQEVGLWWGWGWVLLTSWQIDFWWAQSQWRAPNPASSPLSALHPSSRHDSMGMVGPSECLSCGLWHRLCSFAHLKSLGCHLKHNAHHKKWKK